MKQETGQSLVVVALGLVVLVGMFLVVINGGLLYLSRAAFESAVADAATVALRPAQAGTASVSTMQATTAARQVLAIELQNVIALRESPESVAAYAQVEIFTPGDATSCVAVGSECYYGPVVRVTGTGTLCLLVGGCFPITIQRHSALETTLVPPPPAAPIPGFKVEITLP